MALLIFDLDGTLIDSRLDLANAVNATLAEFKRPSLAHEVVFSYVGNGAPVLIQRVMGPEATEGEVKKALEFFIAYYSKHAVDHTRFYPGVREALDQLHAAGTTLAVLTNKPVRISNHIMEQLGVAPLMFRVYGGNSFEFKKPHPIGIHTLRAEANSPAQDTWMVGDSSVDIQTARNAGVAACGVSWGLQPETFQQHPPDVLIDDLRVFARRFIA